MIPKPTLKTLSIVAVALIILTIVAACGAAEEPGAPRSPQPAAPAQPAAAVDAGAPKEPAAPAQPNPAAAAPTAMPAMTAPTEGAQVVPTVVRRVVEEEAMDEPMSGGTLVNYLLRSPIHFSPLEVTTFIVAWPFQNLHSQLFYYDPQVAPEGAPTILPDLAEEWSWSSDGLALTIGLRDGVLWHDGQPFRAQDVKWTADSILEMPGGGTFDVNARKPWWVNVESVDAPDDDTIVFNMKQIQPSLMSFLASAFSPIYSEHIKPITRLQTEAVGTGPFKFKGYRPGEVLEMERNTDFYLDGLPYLDGIQFPIITDRSTRIAALATGRVDLSNALDMNPTTLKDLQASSPNLVVKGGVTTLHETIIFNTQRPPLDDIRIRQAVLLTLDRDAWNRIVHEGAAVPSTTNLRQPFGTWGLPEDQALELIGKPDRERARQLVQEVGFEFDRELEIHHRPFVAAEALGQWLVDQLKEIGIPAVAVPLDPGVKAQRFRSGDFDMSGDSDGFVVDEADDPFLRYFTCGGSIFPVINFCDPVLEEMVLAQSAELDFETRLKMVHEIDRYIFENALPRQVIGFQSDWQVMQPYVMGYVKRQVIHNNSRFEQIWLNR